MKKLIVLALLFSLPATLVAKDIIRDVGVVEVPNVDHKDKVIVAGRVKLSKTFIEKFIGKENTNKIFVEVHAFGKQLGSTNLPKKMKGSASWEAWCDVKELSKQQRKAVRNREVELRITYDGRELYRK